LYYKQLLRTRAHTDKQTQTHAGTQTQAQTHMPVQTHIIHINFTHYSTLTADGADRRARVESGEIACGLKNTPVVLRSYVLEHDSAVEIY